MIVIAGNKLTNFDDTMLPELERIIYQKKMGSSFEQQYDSMDEFLFELHMRGRVVEAARLLNKSGIQFAGFKNTRCNDAFWTITEYGGIQLKDGVAPRDAINDIFRNGSKYAIECATAIVIILYKAVLDSINPEQFDRLFADLLLFDWHYNSNLRILRRSNVQQAEAGDVLYFENPDFSPKTPWWRGENVILLENGKYYGHGLGIRSGSEMIAALNKYRVPDSNKSAYLSDSYEQLYFNYFRQFRTGVRSSRVRAIIGGSAFSIYI
ncbi:protein-glutamine gamma-glutamyltransferase [Paenibacillus piri]|uniref:Protein-glutamine gamma-glutamyltransferase n=1 Tax=Paenibacillus piri TaxID=2547395 RepID=A0A4R5KKP3_9BACL|nr:protein-glutamine gamma-glutamyltransferase [Paenibacillus piri]TDF96139.1 protein-glutamine gamma-glutamyltransferase [Paenibacillus piri]